MWLIELLWGVLLLDTAESLWQSRGGGERPCHVKSDVGAGGLPHLSKVDVKQLGHS